MRYLGVTLLVIAAVAVGVVLAPSGPARGQAAPPQWEYKLVLDNGFKYNDKAVLGMAGLYDNEEHEKNLNRLGAEGWELVDVQIFDRDANSRQYIFKRPKPR
jgi:hypothetical protein